jgi:hypothetical protein
VLLKIASNEISFFSWMLILTWLLGDAFKTTYFVWNRAPTPFVTCGCIQLTIDVLIALQMSFDWFKQRLVLQ